MGIGPTLDREFHLLLVTARSSDQDDQFIDTSVTFSDPVFGFWEDVQVPMKNSSESFNDSLDEYHNEEEEEAKEKMEYENFCSIEMNKAYWEEQDQLLQATIRRTSSIETRVRQATKEALRELKVSDIKCLCRLAEPTKSCRNCLKQQVCNRLLCLGYNCAICKSKWTSSSEIPSGEHIYLEVTDKSNSKKAEVKVVIELNFRAEFEMAKANEEYNKLISRLPEVFVGKSERLKVLIKIMCSAAKKCMKEKKMHLGPWRKHKYMQAKWLGNRSNNNIINSSITPTLRHQKSKASMLTFDLLENIPSMHYAAVGVVV
ncbi:hypothetical protein PIB30_001123 [Stylosanthes scabra]|uniref:Uncharacterized protein n=1 Tax=Stylosanthes scabra TaxID=79078 RepID=A0ABU6U1F2_9FABA|nr:hypothetical protein [Stylosanthes scabra]